MPKKLVEFPSMILSMLKMINWVIKNQKKESEESLICLLMIQMQTLLLWLIKKIFKDLGENMSDEELKDMLERASKNGVELTFEEFYDIMTKKSFP